LKSPSPPQSQSEPGPSGGEDPSHSLAIPPSSWYGFIDHPRLRRSPTIPNETIDPTLPLGEDSDPFRFTGIPSLPRYHLRTVDSLTRRHPYHPSSSTTGLPGEEHSLHLYGSTGNPILGEHSSTLHPIYGSTGNQSSSTGPIHFNPSSDSESQSTKGKQKDPTSLSPPASGPGLHGDRTTPSHGPDTPNQQYFKDYLDSLAGFDDLGNGSIICNLLDTRHGTRCGKILKKNSLQKHLRIHEGMNGDFAKGIKRRRKKPN